VYSLKKGLDKMEPNLKLNNNPHIASIIDLNQTPGSSDLAMIAPWKLFRHRGLSIRIPA
jgi:hypothetical protein